MPVKSPALMVISDTAAKSVPSIAVPPVPSIDTVTSAYVLPDSNAVKTIVLPEFSAIELLAADSVTVGAVSLSVIVRVTC